MGTEPTCEEDRIPQEELESKIRGLSPPDFVSFIEAGGFSLAEYRKGMKSGGVFSSCMNCPIAKYLQARINPDCGVGDRVIWCGTRALALPHWLQKAVRLFDREYLTWNERQMLLEFGALKKLEGE